MSFIQKLLARAGLIVIEGPAAEADKPVDPNAPTQPLVERRSLTLEELLRETRETTARAQEELQAAATGLSAEPDEVFAAANIPAPEHGWTIERARAFVGDPARVAAGPQEQRRALAAQLAIEQIPPEDLFRDAHTRDVALDAYEGFLGARVREVRRGLAKEEDELAEKRKEIDARLGAIAGEKLALDERWQAWRTKKRERELSWAQVLKLLTPDGALDDAWVSISEEDD